VTLYLCGPTVMTLYLCGPTIVTPYLCVPTVITPIGRYYLKIFKKTLINYLFEGLEISDWISSNGTVSTWWDFRRPWFDCSCLSETAIIKWELQPTWYKLNARENRKYNSETQKNESRNSKPGKYNLRKRRCFGNDEVLNWTVYITL
jgi:hypothetical protein